MSPRTQEQYQAMREQSHTKILETAMELFSKYGYGNTPISKIAKEANISKGLVYNYFSSKKELLEAIFDLAMREMDSMFEKQKDKPAREQLEELIEVYFRELAEKRDFWKLFTTLALQEEGFEDIKQMMAKKIQDYYSILEELLEAAIYPDPKEEARLLGATFDGIAVQYLVLGKEFPLESFKQHLLRKYNPYAQ